MAALLSDEALKRERSSVPLWQHDAPTKIISRTVKAGSFLQGINWVRDVASMAEAMNHHPDIDIRWRTITFVLSTHSAGGLTSLDFELARKIDGLVD